MFIPFESLPDHARVWVYQANRKFTAAEADIISQALSSFTQQWEVHGQPMKTSFKLCFDQFIVLAADEGYNAASGCSIDGSVRAMKGLGVTLNIDLLDRNAVAFKNENGVLLIPVSQLKQQLVSGSWNSKSLVFNNLIANKGELDKQWIISAGETWLRRYLSDELIKL